MPGVFRKVDNIAYARAKARLIRTRQRFCELGKVRFFKRILKYANFKTTRS